MFVGHLRGDLSFSQPERTCLFKLFNRAFLPEALLHAASGSGLHVSGKAERQN
jgi:hypothetical protein